MSRWFQENQGKECRRFGEDADPPTARKPTFEKAAVVEHEVVTVGGEPLPKLVLPRKRVSNIPGVVPASSLLTTETQPPLTTESPAPLTTEIAVTTKKRGRKPKMVSWTSTDAVVPLAEAWPEGPRYYAGPLISVKRGRPALTEAERATKRKASMDKANKKRRDK